MPKQLGHKRDKLHQKHTRDRFLIQLQTGRFSG
ncbi:DUF2740 family protein [Salmonella enterica subsp. enterica]|nr:DUF2740 family protein [Salmonella enterica subsp. enterica]